MYDAMQQLVHDRTSARLREADAERLARATGRDGVATFLQRRLATVSVRWSTGFEKRRTHSPLRLLAATLPQRLRSMPTTESYSRPPLS